MTSSCLRLLPKTWIWIFKLGSIIKLSPISFAVVWVSFYLFVSFCMLISILVSSKVWKYNSF
jgi:hypothetical protein